MRGNIAPLFRLFHSNSFLLRFSRYCSPSVCSAILCLCEDASAVLPWIKSGALRCRSFLPWLYCIAGLDVTFEFTTATRRVSLFGNRDVTGQALTELKNLNYHCSFNAELLHWMTCVSIHKFWMSEVLSTFPVLKMDFLIRVGGVGNWYPGIDGILAGICRVLFLDLGRIPSPNPCNRRSRA